MEASKSKSLGNFWQQQQRPTRPIGERIFIRMMATRHETRNEIMSHRESCAPREERLACRACAVLRDHFPKLCVGINTFAGSGDEAATQTVQETTPSPEGRVVLTKSAFVDHNWMDDPDLLFVSFIGFLRGHDPFGPARWRCDQNMCEELLTMTPTVYSYVSVPTNDDRGDWFNLVLFKDPGFLQTFETSLFHRHAIEFLSPDSFSHICVRSGTWHGGVGPRGKAQGTSTRYM